MAAKTLDLRGQICPDPLTQTQAAVKRMGAGETLIVLVDYPLAVESIARWAEREGLKVSIEKLGGEWRLTLEKPP